MTIRDSAGRATAVILLFASLFGCERATPPAARQATAGATDMSKKGPPCSEAQVEGPHHYYCIGPKWVSKDSYCLRQSGDDPQHVRRLEFASGELPEALMTRGKDANGNFRLGHATIDGKPKVPQNGETCGKHATPFVEEGDQLSILPNDQGKLTMLIIKANGGVKPGFEHPLELTPDPDGGHYYWTVDVQTKDKGVLNLYVMLTDDEGGDMTMNSPSGVPWIERYIRIEAYRQTDESDDPDCHNRRPSIDKTKATPPSEKFNFYKWDTNTDTCLSTGGAHENGTGSGGHNYP